MTILTVQENIERLAWMHPNSPCQIKDGIEIDIVDEDLFENFQKIIESKRWLNKWKQKLLK